MTQLIALYRKPADVAAFDRYYFESHVPLAKTIAGLRRYQVSRGPVMSPTGESPWHLVATLSFDSMPDLQAALASPQGQATAADLANFATAGVELLVFENSEI